MIGQCRVEKVSSAPFSRKLDKIVICVRFVARIIEYPVKVIAMRKVEWLTLALLVCKIRSPACFVSPRQ